MKNLHWHWPMYPIPWINSIAIYWNDWWQFFAFIGFCYIFIWNVYAYPRGKSMLAFPKMGADVSKRGDNKVRHFLFVASIGLYMLINLAWFMRFYKIV